MPSCADTDWGCRLTQKEKASFLHTVHTPAVSLSEMMRGSGWGRGGVGEKEDANVPLFCAFHPHFVFPLLKSLPKVPATPWMHTDARNDVTPVTSFIMGAGALTHGMIIKFQLHLLKVLKWMWPHEWKRMSKLLLNYHLKGNVMIQAYTVHPNPTTHPRGS